MQIGSNSNSLVDLMGDEFDYSTEVEMILKHEALEFACPRTPPSATRRSLNPLRRTFTTGNRSGQVNLSIVYIAPLERKKNRKKKLTETKIGGIL